MMQAVLCIAVLYLLVRNTTISDLQIRVEDLEKKL